ncbi:hypothetical protein [Streptomyces sp. UNOB3_S3]|uniref:hypothetical protein n=1 Tax=Streptomyces sp. UNOB3_S3 TaxID=2871682 RepID=UPI001E6053AD|nr:hypothetical protein [Streptomyces sp. UNOB3_S3]MCC3773663.1 hypothetical protein [Streptomyces sp. UNOB3_S3]
MAAPPIESWAQRETITARKLNAQVRDPLRYLADPPRMSCRGAAPGQSITRGSSTVIRWSTADTNTFSSDAERRWFTVPDTGVYVVSGSVSVKSGATQAAGDGVIVYLYRRTSTGTVSVVTVREIIQQSNDVQTVSAATVVHLAAGDALAVAVYLESGSPSPAYAVQTGEGEGAFTAWMAAPTTSFSAAATPFAPAGEWRDGEQVTPATMTARISDPIRALYNPPRVSVARPLPYSTPPNQALRVGWSMAGFEESGGWVLSRDGTAVTAPATGVYLVALTLATQRDGPEGAFGSYQVNLLRNGSLLFLRQRQNTRSTYPTSISSTGLVFLSKGDFLGVDFLGTGTDVTWQDYGTDLRTERWNGLSAVMLAPGATSMKG